MAPRVEVRQLIEPIQQGAEQLTSISITFRRKFLRGQQLNFMADGSDKASLSEQRAGGLRISTDALLDIAGKMIGHHPDILDEMHDDDADYILEKARDFFMGVLGSEKDKTKKPS